MAKRARRTRATTPESQEALRSTIIDAARRLFKEGGIEAVSMRAVADKVGCTAGALYRYFPDKQNLLLYVWEDDMRYLAEYVRGAVDHTDDPVEKIRQTFLGYVRYWEQNPDSFANLFALVHSDLDRSETPDVFPDTGSNALYFDMRDLLARQLKGKKNAPQDADLAMQCLLCTVHGSLALHLSASHFPWYNLQEMARAAIDGMLAGWGLIKTPSVAATVLKRRQRPKS